MATLQVEFTGLCMYIPNPDQNEVTVVMPDCRRSFADDLHSDGERGEPHVGYLSIPLIKLGIDVTRAPDAAEPEAVYQFDRQELDFGVDPAALTKLSLGVPSFSRILGAAPQLKTGVLQATGAAPDELLFRTVLRGGTVEGRRGNGNWTIASTGAPYEGQFSEVIIWKREIPDDDLVLTLWSLDAPNGAKQEFKLNPGPDGIIKLKIANLCSTNPLEWDALITHLERDRDRDFKWLYRLLDTQAPLSVPVLAGFQAFGTEDCLGGCAGPFC